MLDIDNGSQPFKWLLITMLVTSNCFPVLICLEPHFRQDNRLLGKFSWIYREHFHMQVNMSLLFSSFLPLPHKCLFLLCSSTLWMSHLSQKLWKHFWFFSWSSPIQTVSKSCSLWSNISQIHLFIPVLPLPPHSLFLCRAPVGIWGCYGFNCILSVVGLRISECGLI